MKSYILKPCPFCGSKAKIICNVERDDGEPVGEYYFVRCTNDACPRNRVFDTHRRAVRSWNRRIKND